MSKLAFSKINFNLYVSSGNENTANKYIRTQLPKDAGNNAPLIKYGDDYFVPSSVGIVRYNGQDYFVIETKCEKNNKVFYLCVPIDITPNDRLQHNLPYNSITDYLNASKSTGSTVVNFDIQTVIVSNDAKIKTVGDPNYYTCLIDKPLPVPGTSPSWTSNTQSGNAEPFKNIQLGTFEGATPIQLENGTIQTKMTCKRATGTDNNDNKNVIEDTPDQLINRMMTIIGYIIAILIVYSIAFEWLFEEFVIQFMTDKNGLQHGYPFAGYYFGIITVLFGVSLLIYSAVHRSSTHMYIGLSFFGLIGLTNFLYNKNFYNETKSSLIHVDITKTITHIWSKSKIWSGAFILMIILMVAATFTSFIPEYKHADTVSFAFFGLAILCFCFPIDKINETPDLSRYWVRFYLIFALVLIISITWGVAHAEVYIPS